jgi:TetR/AcrR family transcriptional repressor of nem operon
LEAPDRPAWNWKTMGRPREFNTGDVMDKVVELFWHKGFAATSIDDLTQATGLKRGSLYQAFGSKGELFTAAMDHYLRDGVVERLRAIPDSEPLHRMLDTLFHEIITLAISDPDRKGCFLTNTAVELSPHDPEIADTVRAYMERLEHLLIGRIEMAMQSGELRPGRDPAALARLVLVTIQGLRVMAKVDPDREALQSVADALIESITT